MPIYNIGRDLKDPFEIDEKHASVSHVHASIIVEGDRWTLVDNNSTNGTYIEENGIFRRYDKVDITPYTWIRLGEEGHRGYYFKARRVIYPNDYREDFEELYTIFQIYGDTKNKLESLTRKIRFTTPVLMIAGLALSFIPAIRQNEIGVRASFMLPGFLSPVIQHYLLNRLRTNLNCLQKMLICPKCRRTIGKDDIINREHLFCHAH